MCDEHDDHLAQRELVAIRSMEKAIEYHQEYFNLERYR